MRISWEFSSSCLVYSYYPAGEAGVGIKGCVGGGSVSSTWSPIGSHMAGPITVKLGIDQGNSVSVLSSGLEVG